MEAAERGKSMILNNDEIKTARIVQDAVEKHRRPTTYDASIGEFILDGECLEPDVFSLPPRGIVWVVSRETFKFGPEHTGLATLKTTLTHLGILALNVGVIDPEWDGPLSTALVNFSGAVVRLKRGDPFFRVLVMSHHTPTVREPRTEERMKYTGDVVSRSRRFADTFLDMRSLVDDVAREVFMLPKLGVAIGVSALLLAVAAITIPMGYYIYADQSKATAKTLELERRLDQLE